MEIQELNLLAFGPFTDKLLEFKSPKVGGLHIVYGPNEAGKSSALRALKALLFGIPTRTTDNFLHENRALRIGGKLRNHSGQELVLVRRKGNKNTLLSPGENQLDDSVLAPYMQGVSAELFEMLFGIDHVTLVQGGQEILEQKGDVGQALFAASMGSSRLHSVLEQLDSEADELFKPRGSSQLINTALKEYDQLQKSIKEQSLSSSKWGDSSRALEQTTIDLDAVQDELVEAKAERSRLQRIQRALPKIAARREYLVQLQVLGEVVVLTDDFGSRRQMAMLELEKARERTSSSSSNLHGLQQQIAKIMLNSDVLSLAETIEDLHQRLGVHRKEIQERPHLEARCSQLITNAESLLKSVRPEIALDHAENLRPVLSKSTRIAELGNQHQALTERVAKSGKILSQSTSRLQQLRVDHQNLAAVGSIDALRNQITLTRKYGDLDEALRTIERENEVLEAACQNSLSKQGALWSGTLDEVCGLLLPATVSIESFEQEYTELAKQIQRLTEKQGEYIRAAQDAQKQLDEILHAGAVPTEQNLIAARSDRGRAWGLIRRQWLDGETVDAEVRELDPNHALPELFEARVDEADELADRLRREAGRVQKQASLLASLADAENRTKQTKQNLDAFAQNQLDIDRRWGSLWQPSDIKPLPPREMRGWLDDMGKLQAQFGTLSAQSRQASDLTTTRNQHIQTLQQELKALGKESATTCSLEALLVESESVVSNIEGLARQQKTLDTNIKTQELEQESAQSEKKEATQALEAWRRQWHEVVGDLGLGTESVPADVTDILESIRNLFGALKDLEDCSGRIKSINADAEIFRDEVVGVVTRVAPDLTQLPPEQAVEQLTSLVTDAGQQKSKWLQLKQQIQTAEDDIAEAEALRKNMDERLNALCMEAQCKDSPELEPAERRSREYLQLKANIKTFEQELREYGEGMTLVELEAAADKANPDELPGQIDALTSLIDIELDPRKTELAEDRGEKRKELGLMDGSDDAAALADESQSVLVGIRDKAERYVRVKLAARILRDEIERYRQQHQGPLIDRASEHFSVLTQGSFSGLRTDYNDKDDPVLVGVRQNETRVYVEGMSSGTRDQLYLALRLASLEKYMESAEPMPFIVDDILVHFDDDRSRATLGLLAELAEKTQIIMFTHHRRLIEQAQKLDITESVMVYEI